MMCKMAIFLVFVCVISVMHAAPLARRMVDMTHIFDHTTLHFPTVKEYEMKLLFWNEDSVDPIHPW